MNNTCDAYRDEWAYLPPPPARVLAVGISAGEPAARGYQVTVLSAEQMAEVCSPDVAQRNPGGSPGFRCAASGLQYDVLLLREFLQNQPDLGALFARVRCLLVPGGRLVITERVAYDSAQRKRHSARAIEQHLGEQGFVVRRHQRISPDSGGDAYERWEARPEDFVIRAGRAAEAPVIVDTFQRVFNTPRTPAHWQWKFGDNPWGGPYISTVWHADKLVAHYAGYPLLFNTGAEQNATIYHVGDTLTDPAYRGVGRGPTSLLGRAFRHFERQFCENQILFGYGFNTGKIRKFGTLFLGYQADLPVYEWLLYGDALARLQQAPRWRMQLRGYHVKAVSEAGPWADRVWRKARADYPWLTRRDAAYLRWRYQQHPDYAHTFYVVYHWGRPVGWWLARMEGDGLWLGDALFQRAHALRAARLGLLSALRHNPREVRSWFAETPAWWNEILRHHGFAKHRHCHDLNFCVKSYTRGLTETEIGRQFYFTWGDSDLF